MNYSTSRTHDCFLQLSQNSRKATRLLKCTRNLDSPPARNWKRPRTYKYIPATRNDALFVFLFFCRPSYSGLILSSMELHWSWSNWKNPWTMNIEFACRRDYVYLLRALRWSGVRVVAERGEIRGPILVFPPGRSVL